jgi:hypothetical protein
VSAKLYFSIFDRLIFDFIEKRRKTPGFSPEI